MSIARSALERIQPRVVSYEEPVTTIREQLAATLEREEDWAKAAQVLAGIDLDSGAPDWVLQTLSNISNISWCKRPVHAHWPLPAGAYSHLFVYVGQQPVLLLCFKKAGTWAQGSTGGTEPGTNFTCSGGGYERALLAGMRVLDNEYKLRQNIKIAMLYLEDDDAVNAEAFIKKAASLITSSKVGWADNRNTKCCAVVCDRDSDHA